MTEQSTTANESPTGRDEPFPLQDDERELIAGELQALIAALPGDRSAPYKALAAAAEHGIVPAAGVETLEKALELILGSGRARHMYRAEGERLLEALYDRTPRGQARRADLASTNHALRALVGQPLDSVRVGSSVSGRHTITIASSALQLTLVVDRNGVRVDKAGV